MKTFPFLEDSNKISHGTRKTTTQRNKLPIEKMTMQAVWSIRLRSQSTSVEIQVSYRSYYYYALLRGCKSSVKCSRAKLHLLWHEIKVVTATRTLTFCQIYHVVNMINYWITVPGSRKMHVSGFTGDKSHLWTNSWIDFWPFFEGLPLRVFCVMDNPCLLQKPFKNPLKNHFLTAQ